MKVELTNPALDKEDSNRVYRGGSWVFLARYAHASDRDRNAPFVRDVYLGFRLVRNR